jgi:hypothetical protein
MRLAKARRECSVFTRCVPPERPEEAVGAWRRYYQRWRNMTGEQLNLRLIELVPPLAALALADLVIDRPITHRLSQKLSCGRSGGWNPEPS